MFRSHVLICGGTGCMSNGSAQIIENFNTELEKHGLDKEIAVVKTGCHGLCAQGPIVIVYPENICYSQVKAEDVAEIVSEHLPKAVLSIV